MNYRKFGRTGWEVSEIGYGMWGMAEWTGSEEKEIHEALDKAILRRLARRDVVPLDGDISRPGQHRVRRQFSPVVADDHLRPAALGNQIGQFAHDPPARD